MLKYKTEVKEVLEATAWLVKSYDPDGVDLIFTKGDRHVKGVHDVKKVLKTFDKVDFTGTTNMQMRLGDRLSEYKEKIKKTRSGSLSTLIPGLRRRELRRLSLYVLTDGIWQPGCDVETPITSMVNKLKEHDLLDKQVGIQFIRFGHDEAAIRHLDYLDRELKPDLNL